MAQDSQNQSDEIQKQIFEKIAKNDREGFKQVIPQLKRSVNFVDENGMTPLQHACCKGNKEIVQILLDLGADINYNQHGANYTPLHFAAISGSTEVCRMLLDAGINPNSINSVSRTASQMAAFVGNHTCVETINNYVSRAQLEYYTQTHGQKQEPLIPPTFESPLQIQQQEILIPPTLLTAFHAFIIEVNLHPVRIALNLQAQGLLKHMPGLRKAVGLMCRKEMKKSHDVNELMAFKYHYLYWILSELMRCEEQCKAQRKDSKYAEGGAEAGKHDYVELFIKRVLKENKLGQLDYVEFTVRECVREFPFRECTIFRQVVSQLAAKEAPPALSVLRYAINGQRGFVDESFYCSTCGNEKPDKKCSKCKAVQYCDRECQRLHWFMHKKTCARPTSNSVTPASSAAKEPIDANTLLEEITKMTAS